MGKMIHSPADVFFPPPPFAEKPSRSPNGNPLARRKVLCCSLSSHGPMAGFVQKPGIFTPSSPPIRCTVYGENDDHTSDIMRLSPPKKGPWFSESQSLFWPKVQTSSDTLLGICWDGGGEVRPHRGARTCFGGWGVWVNIELQTKR